MKRSYKALWGALLLSVFILSACGGKGNDKANDVATNTEIAAETTIDDKRALEQAKEYDDEINSWDLTIKPSFGTIELADYSKMKAEEAEHREVTDADVSDYIEQTILKSNAESSDDAIAMGDIVVGNFVSAETGGVEGLDFQVGSAYFSDALDKALIGHKKGEEFDVSFTFPEDYFMQDAAGKDTVMHVTITDVKKIPSDLSDEAAVAAGYENASSAKESIKEELISDQLTYEDEERSATIYDSLFNASDIKPSDEAIEWLSKYLVTEDAKFIEKNEPEAGLTYGMLLVSNKTTLSEMLDSMKEDNEEFVKHILFDDAILLKEGRSITDDDINSYLEKYGYSSKDEAIEDYTEFFLERNVMNETVMKILTEKYSE